MEDSRVKSAPCPNLGRGTKRAANSLISLSIGQTFAHGEFFAVWTLSRHCITRAKRVIWLICN
jgi:hypothetical protein